MDDHVIAFIREWLWAPALALIGWAWNRNEKEHSMLWKKSEKLEAGMLTASSGLNDRLMEHIDTQVRETRAFVINEDTRIIAEVTRQRDVAATIFNKLEENNRRSEDRHNETMSAIHSLAMAMHEGLAKKADK